MGIGAVKSKQHNQILKHKQNPYIQLITDFGKTNKSAPTTNKFGEQVLSSVAISEQTSHVSTVPV